MYYYIRSHYSGWHEVNRGHYRDYRDYLRRSIPNAADRDRLISERIRRYRLPLTIADLMGGAGLV